MKEVVWVFGVSASGKATLINSLVSNKLAKLIKRFGWQNKKIIACDESLELIGGELDGLRKKILDTTPKLLDKSDIVLIKWQTVDSIANRPQRLKKLLPEARHWIIELRVGIDELVGRLPKKELWTNYGREKDLYDVEFKVVSEKLSELSDEFEIISLNSSSSGSYELIERA